VTPGQMAALYDGDEVLGGGWIMPAPATPLEACGWPPQDRPPD
jgi:hypothetical protein